MRLAGRSEVEDLLDNSDDLEQEPSYPLKQSTALQEYDEGWSPVAMKSPPLRTIHDNLIRISNRDSRVMASTGRELGRPRVPITRKPTLSIKEEKEPSLFDLHRRQPSSSSQASGARAKQPAVNRSQAKLNTVEPPSNIKFMTNVLDRLNQTKDRIIQLGQDTNHQNMCSRPLESRIKATFSIQDKPPRSEEKASNTQKFHRFKRGGTKRLEQGPSVDVTKTQKVLPVVLFDSQAIRDHSVATSTGRLEPWPVEPAQTGGRGRAGGGSGEGILSLKLQNSQVQLSQAFAALYGRRDPAVVNSNAGRKAGQARGRSDGTQQPTARRVPRRLS